MRPYIEDNAQLHGCVRDGLLLPGETKFESLALEAMPQGPYDLSVDVEIMERPVGSTAPFSTRRLSWKGRLSDAIALGAKLKAALLR